MKRNHWPLLGLLTALALVCLGQFYRLYLRQYGWDAAIFFAAGSALFVWTLRFAGGAQAPAPSSPATDGPPQDRVRWWMLLPVVLLVVAAWWQSSANTLTLSGVVGWWGAVVVFIAAFWQRGRSTSTSTPALPLRGGGSNSHLAEILIVVGLIVLAAFFRFYQLDAVPPEMNSDHVEKLLDVYDVLHGQRPIFFERNTGREPMQFYMAVAVIRLFDTGLTHYTLKVTNALMGILTLVGVYLLGREIGGRRLAFAAAFFTAVSIWPVATSRVGLRFPFAPAFTSLALWSLLRALRTNRRNAWLIAGLVLGMGLHGYTAFRFMPGAAAVMTVLHLLANWRKALAEWVRWLGNLALYVVVSALVFLPLAHYMLDKPQMFWYRSLTRAGGLERVVNGNPWLVLVYTFSRTIGMFNWRGDEVWVSTIRDAPVLDAIGGGLFLLGFLYAVFYLGRRRTLLAAQLIMGGVILLMPSMLNLAFPNESPSVVRAGGAIPLVAVLVGLALLYLADQGQGSLSGIEGKMAAWLLVAVLLTSLTAINFQRYFVGYRAQYQAAAMNTREVSQAIRDYLSVNGGSFAYVYHKAYPHWLDSRALALQVAQAPGWANTNVTLQPPALSGFRLNPTGPTLFLLHPSDLESLNVLQGFYPGGRAQLIPSATPGHDFVFFTVPRRL